MNNGTILGTVAAVFSLGSAGLHPAFAQEADAAQTAQDRREPIIDDSEFDAMAGYSVTDDVKYDARFRKHALSRIRATFPDIVSSIQIANSEDATSAD